MLIARTRSSRFFIVVLHLVCVSTHLRSKGARENNSFIFWSETVATLQIQTVHTSVSMTSMIESSNRNAAIHDINQLEPYWLQDSHDQQCLGPMGHFSECGDANLWRMIPKSKRHARRRQWIRWAIEADEDDQEELQGYYALQIFDQDISEFYSTQSEKLSERNAQGANPADSNSDFVNKECMTRRRKDNKLVVVPCSEDRAWYWRVNEYGILHFDKPARGFGSSSRRASSGNKKRLLNKRQNLESCVWRKNASVAILSPCDGNQPSFTVQNTTSSLDWNGEERVAQVQFVRHNYQRDANVHSRPFGSAKKLQNIKTEVETGKQANKERQKVSETSRTSLSLTGNTNLPSRVDIAHSHASVPSDRTESRFSTFQVTPLSSHRSSETVSKQIPRFLGNTNPILIATGPKLTAAAATTTSKESAGTSGIGNNKNKMRKKSTRITGNDKNSLKTMIHNNDNTSPSLSENPIVRKIQTNPYVAASKDERWVDPQTGLIYRTDLCQYLGHERKDVGRHTLTGVGQYTKTMLNIKVSKKGEYAHQYQKDRMLRHLYVCMLIFFMSIRPPNYDEIKLLYLSMKQGLWGRFVCL